MPLSAIGRVKFLQLSEQQCVAAVPELSYTLSSGARITITVSGHFCRSLVECCEQSNLHGREVGGMIVGFHCGRQDHTLVATDLIPVPSSDSSSVHLSFTHGAWKCAERELRARFVPQGKRRIGWYHTHPVQGIFFSARDEIAHSVFPEAYHFALVADPGRMEAGLFYRAHSGQAVAGPIRFGLTQGKD